MLEAAIIVQPRMNMQKLFAGHRRHARAHVVPRVPELCQGCVWLRTDSGTAMCPFARCVRREGWTVEENVGFSFDVDAV